MTSFEDWRAQDDRWLERHRELIQIVFQWFIEHGTWPEVGVLQRQLHQSGERALDVQAVADAKPTIPGQLALRPSPSLTLGCRHLLGLPEARPILNLVVAVTQQAVRAYLAPGDTPTVTRADVGLQAFTDPISSSRLFELLSCDHPDAFAGGSPGENWSMNVDSALVMRFEKVTDPEDYVSRQLEVIQEWAEAQDERSGLLSPPEPAKAFVVMPFGEEWSDEVYGFIRRAADSLDGALQVLRADEISETGRITDQIVDALRTSDLIIADITGHNRNVAWELGYAYAHSKPCAIVMRRSESSVPFDIYDHRRIDYSDTPSQDEQDRLAQVLRSAIGL